MNKLGQYGFYLKVQFDRHETQAFCEVLKQAIIARIEHKQATGEIPQLTNATKAQLPNLVDQVILDATRNGTVSVPQPN